MQSIHVSLSLSLPLLLSPPIPREASPDIEFLQPESVTIAINTKSANENTHRGMFGNLGLLFLFACHSLCKSALCLFLFCDRASLSARSAFRHVVVGSQQAGRRTHLGSARRRRRCISDVGPIYLLSFILHLFSPCFRMSCSPLVLPSHVLRVAMLLCDSDPGDVLESAPRQSRQPLQIAGFGFPKGCFYASPAFPSSFGPSCGARSCFFFRSAARWGFLARAFASVNRSES